MRLLHPLTVSLRCTALSLWLGCAGSMGGESAERISHDGGAPSGGDPHSDSGGDPQSKDAASADADVPQGAPHVDADKPGPYPVGTLRLELEVTSGRTLPVQLWYPAVEAARAEAERGRPLSDIEPTGPRKELLTALIAAAPDGCTNKTMHAAPAPTVLAQDARFPAVVFSHCLDCTRFSSFSSAEHLASWGFVVAAPDHEGGTLYDKQAGASVGMTADFLETRALDISGVFDALLDAESKTLPSGLRGRIDPEKLGVFGHSYGSVTAGLVLQNDTRMRAGVLIAAPPEDASLGKVSVAKISQPSLFLLAREDNSISEVGNIALRANYAAYPNEAWLVEVADAGHWSFSDLAGLVTDFNAGCGQGTRQTSEGVTFAYLDNEIARGISKAYTLAYFARELMQDEVAAEYLKSPTPTDVVLLQHHK